MQVLKNRSVFFIILLLLTGFVQMATAQQDIFNRARGLGQGSTSGKGDTLQHRTGLEDSITIRFRYLDSTRLRAPDTLLADFTKVFPLAWHQINLGNLGTPSRSLIFTPWVKPGWDHGFHNLDANNYTVEETRLYNTTRPFSELDYLLGSRAEQMIQLTHTQNVRPNWNLGFQYRLINSKGLFVNQNTNHNNYRLHSWYQSKNKRYQQFIIIVGNKLGAGENGGIRDDGNYLDSTGFSNRPSIPSKLGNPNNVGDNNFFSTNVTTGAFYTNATYLLRQQYDLGQKDSMIVNDTTVVPLFYPRLRMEHTISYNTYHYRFRDDYGDSTYYQNTYNIHFDSSATPTKVLYRDNWRVLSNDFSLYQFPDAKNAAQFIKVGATFENIKGTFDTMSVNKGNFSDHNFFVHGEYRNKTKNQKWDMEAIGNFYVSGYNAGDYNAYLSLKRFVNPTIGYLQIGFQNVNRKPSFIYNEASALYKGDPVTLNKENITNIFASADMPKLKLKLTGNYFLVTNLAFYNGFRQAAQSSSLFNLLQITGERTFRLSKKLIWRPIIVLQQRAGDGPVNVPLITTRNLIGYEGNLGFRRLQTSFGLEIRYFTPYKAPGYSPIPGQYYYQDTAEIKLKRPDISAYCHFRIRTFTAYVRAENLNTFNTSDGGFTKNNVPTIGYPYPGLQFRVGIFWAFVN